MKLAICKLSLFVARPLQLQNGREIDYILDCLMKNAITQYLSKLYNRGLAWQIPASSNPFLSLFSPPYLAH